MQTMYPGGAMAADIYGPIAGVDDPPQVQSAATPTEASPPSTPTHSTKIGANPPLTWGGVLANPTSWLIVTIAAAIWCAHYANTGRLL